jgi:hypothetical protein
MRRVHAILSSQELSAHFFPLRLSTLKIALFDHYPLFFWSRLLESKTNEKVKIT